MKLKLLLIALLFFSIKGFSQDATKVFDDVKDVTIRNFGTIKQNNVVKGYYGFYEFDKVDKKTILFKLSILDENLNVIGVKDIEGPTDWSLISSGFDGNNFCFKFYDKKKKSIELHVYDQQAKDVSSSSMKINYKVTNDKYLSFNAVVGPDVDVVGYDGFCDYTFDEDDNSFITTYVNGSTRNTWQQTYVPETKAKAIVPKFLAGDNEIILTGVSKIDKGLYSLKTEESIVAVNTKNGNQLFDVSTDFGDNHVVPINAIFEDGKITVVGLNYSTNKTYTTAPEGLAFLQLDKTGKVLSSNFKTFEESFGKYLPIQDHELQGGYYLYFHNIVRTNKNTNVIIAEKFKKVADAGGIALSLISSTAGPVKLQLENMVIMEYDILGNIISAKEIPKLVGSTVTFPSYTGFLPSYYLAKNADVMGLMDYKFTTTNIDNSEVTFSFVDYGKIDDASEKTANFGQIKYKDGNITVDKLPIKNSKATFSSFYQAKSNHVLQINYFKKDKKLEMNLIKLNN